MPLRDHFHPPISLRHSWKGFHALWPAILVDQLDNDLPDEYAAEPRVNVGIYGESNRGVFDLEPVSLESEGGGVATLPRTVPKPTMTTEFDLGENYEYEVKVFDQSRDRMLVAAVEFVSPANKDRPEHRQAFVAKCVALLMQGICVTIVDLVTTRTVNLYAELLEMFGRHDAVLGNKPPGVYGVTCRTTKVNREPRFESYFHPFELGQPLPELPLWLDDQIHVPLELEPAYEQTCRTLRIA